MAGGGRAHLFSPAGRRWPRSGRTRERHPAFRNRFAALATLALLALPAHAGEAPARVMSLNVCTDQLAMLLAKPGQLVSVSELAGDPSLSFLHEKAAAYPRNAGTAEEVFLARPDAVVTGTFSLHNTTALLRRLGFRVEEFSFEQTLDTIPREIRRMGGILGAGDRAEEIASRFETELKNVEASLCGPSPTAIAYDQNGIALGSGTLADSVMRAAGLRNLAAELGYAGMAPFPLELLVVHRPDIVILREPLTEAPALADQITRHPALRALKTSHVGAYVPPGSWACGAPAVLDAVRALRAVREEAAPCGKAPSG
ncbi:ABC transporter substrate-binding protein [Aquamicrobium sp. LC103]|uniref:ABC transporter substrate-binding protein n=1 Tax=Aquamicrobium sp. LC103 TaxID=1120658 RepID=UPI0009E2DE4D|nr:ABC transporter substrate-binding protein [Aquamicrobium sp. LC103]TKT80234.1 ABC transporter substrate-binding protein [Aquamicrobium sp. LC103]